MKRSTAWTLRGECPVAQAILGVGQGIPVSGDRRFFLVEYERPALVDLHLAARMKNLCSFERAA